MNKKIYNAPNLTIWRYQGDVITLSTGWQENYDDKGAWKDTWASVED